jgi:hypothetical protein
MVKIKKNSKSNYKDWIRYLAKFLNKNKNHQNNCKN